MKLTEEELLLEEWKQNVALYIDQDNRGMQRLNYFLIVNGAMLVFYGQILEGSHINCRLPILLLIAIIGLVFTVMSMFMSIRSHAYIVLRKWQAMLIEQRLKNLTESAKEWKTDEGVITTFTREHVCFNGKRARSVNGEKEGEGKQL